jgi:hypothetical protein
MRVQYNREQAARHTAVPIPPVQARPAYWWRTCCCCECATVVWYYTKLVATKRRTVCMCVRESIECFRSLACVSFKGACRKPLARPKRVTVNVGESCSYRPFSQQRVVSGCQCARIPSSTFRLSPVALRQNISTLILVPSQRLNAQFRGRALHGNNATHVSQSNGQERTGKFEQGPRGGPVGALRAASFGATAPTAWRHNWSRWTGPRRPPPHPHSPVAVAMRTANESRTTLTKAASPTILGGVMASRH